MTCNICGQETTNLRYQTQINQTKHLLADCPVHGTRYLPFTPNLNIPETLTKRLQKENQKSLFSN